MSAAVRPLAPGLGRWLPPSGEAARAAADATGVSASTLFRAARLLATTATGLALLSLLACGWFDRYTSHAFQMANLVHQDGFLGAQVAWYQGWTGRFGANFAWMAAVSTGPWFAELVPTLAVAAWGAILWFALPRAAAATGHRLAGISRLLAVEVVLFATLAIVPALWFDLYKMTGVITYICPVALGTAALGVALGAVGEGRLGGRRLLALAGISALAMGFSDTWGAVQPALLLALALGVTALSGRQRLVARRTALVAGVSTFLGLLILVSAPGNAVRRSFFPKPPRLTTAVGWSIRDGWGFLAGPVGHAWPVLLGVVVAFAVLGLTAEPLRAGARRTGLTPRRVLFVAGTLLVLLVAAHLPAEQMTSAPPPARSEIIPTYATVLAAALLAWLAGISLAARRAAGSGRPYRRVALIGITLATAAMVVAPAVTMATVAQSWRSMSGYAAAKDRQWRQAEAAAPGSDLVLDPVPATGIGPLSHDPMQEAQTSTSWWVNQAMAQYFGLHTVRAAQSPR